MGGLGPQEETHSLGALLFFYPCPTNHLFFAPGPIPPTPNPAPAWDRPLSFSPPFGSLSALQAAHLFPASASPATPPDPTGRPHDTAGPLCRLLSLLSPANKGRAPEPLSGPPGRQREGTKSEGTCPVSAQQQSSILGRGQDGSRGIGVCSLSPPRTSFGEWCLVAGVFTDDSGRNMRRWKRPLYTPPP